MPKNSDATALACHDLANAGNGQLLPFHSQVIFTNFSLAFLALSSVISLLSGNLVGNTVSGLQLFLIISKVIFLRRVNSHQRVAGRDSPFCADGLPKPNGTRLPQRKPMRNE